MIENVNIHEGQGSLQGLRQHLVGSGWLGYAARMIVSKDQRGGIVTKGGLDDFAGVDAGLCQCPFEKLLGGDDAILRVKKDADENLVLQGCEQKAEIITHGCGG